ncbi:MAG: protoporphyrinogen/coproporphyrinogen oxidase [Gemmatimonadota bacterium]
MIIVLGGGIAGLAAARTLSGAGEEYLVLEREEEPGGHCRTIDAGSYAFDRSGHFLHTAEAAMRDWILALPGVSWKETARDARVFLRGKITPYPFQVNLRGHDPAFVSRCLAGFAAARIRAAVRGERDPGDLAGWLLSRFGRAMCSAFFFPYNRKVWRVPLREMTCEWTGWSVPVPRFEDLLAGARGEERGGLGYNASFLYPRRGGIGALPRALARPLRGRIRTGTEALALDLARRVVRTADGKVLPYRAVVSTIPLPELARRSSGLPAGPARAAAALRWVKVLAVNLGVRRPARAPGHWVYVPERRYPFFRVGFLSNVAPSAAPDGCAAVFAEKSFPAGARVDATRETRSAVAALRRMGILSPGSRIEEARPVLLDPAYVVFDRARRRAVPLLLDEFARRGVFPAGRYGAWDYYGMERSMADGIRAARDAMRFAGGPGSRA